MTVAQHMEEIERAKAAVATEAEPNLGRGVELEQEATVKPESEV